MTNVLLLNYNFPKFKAYISVQLYGYLAQAIQDSLQVACFLVNHLEKAERMSMIGRKFSWCINSGNLVGFSPLVAHESTSFWINFYIFFYSKTNAMNCDIFASCFLQSTVGSLCRTARVVKSFQDYTISFLLWQCILGQLSDLHFSSVWIWNT